MVQEKIAIIGVGLIGGSLAKAIKKAHPETVISAFDRPVVLSMALEDKAVDNELNSINEALNADLIFICLPLDESLKVFETLIPELRPGQIITDVCGVKIVFEEIWKKSGSRGKYIGGHPMTGKEKSGYEYSDSLLFENSIYILTNGTHPDDDTTKLADLLASIGSRITFLDASTHDNIVAEVSHLPQLAATSLVNTITDSEKFNYLSFGAGGFRDMTRIASSPFNIWEPIIRQNKEKILSALGSFKEELESVKKLIESDNYKTLAVKFESARLRRDVIPKNTKGFISQLYDVFIYVKDQPGEMSKIATSLFHANINIKDIEVLKMREGTGGTFRLAFDSEEEAEQAKRIIESIGFSTKI